MAVNHVIRRGDSLYGLAGRYLGNFNRWPDIYAFHNEQVKLRGSAHKEVIAIKDPNVIYVGQVLVIPGRGEYPKGKAA
ncbi:MAG: LysM peptidoglycan-binding domain-containing protein, partial [Desulfatitalea sp.]